MVAPGRVELPTFGLGNRCSIHLSYGADGNSPHYLMYFCPEKCGVMLKAGDQGYLI